jgi:peptidyl-prolyl cis-trans isomerase D
MFPIPFDTLIAAGQVGDVFGPFENGANFELVKIVNVKMGPDSVKASHILLPIEVDETTTKAKMDSIKSVIEANNNFAEMASQFSQDPGSASQGGDLGWFTEGQMVPSFNDACFNGKTGDLVIVTSQFGVHLINIVEQTTPKQKVLTAVITNTIEASQATYEKAYNEASTFAITNNDAEKFMAASEEMNRMEAPDLRPNDLTLMGRPNSRQVVRWVFESEVGEVSTPFETNNEFVVALITEMKQEGILPLEMVEDQVRTEVIKEKKAAILSEKMNNPDIKKVAEAIGKPTEEAMQIPFSSFSIPGLGNEQKLLGMAFSLEAGQTSKPIVGDRGVFVIMVNSKNVPDQVTVEEGKRMGLMAGFQNRAAFEPFNAMKSNSEIVDNRYTFF